MTQASKDIKIQAHRAKENQDTDVHRAMRIAEQDLETYTGLKRIAEKRIWKGFKI